METNKSFSTLLQELASEYYNHGLTFNEYREQRRVILDQIDTFFNGVAPEQSTEENDHDGSDGSTVVNRRGESSEAEEENVFSLGGTQTFSLQEILDAQDKKN